MKNFTPNKLCFAIAILFIMVCSNYSYAQGTLQVIGSGININSGDVTPIPADGTDFGTVFIGSNNANTFVFDNTVNGGSNRLTGITVTITGSTDFTPLSSSLGNLGGANPRNHVITFTPTTSGIQTATVTITFSNGTNSGYTFNIQGNGATPLPEINITGNGNNIASGDPTPSTADNTDFGATTIATPITRTFTIQNTDGATLNLGAITFGGTHAAEFTVTTPPAASVAAGGSTTFVVQFLPLALGIRTATISIVNNDTTGGENPYTYALQGQSTTPAPEINITGLGNTISSGDVTPVTTDDTDFGTTTLGVPISHTFTIQNTGTVLLNIGAITFSGSSAAEFTVTTPPTATVAIGGNTTFVIQFNPTGTGTRAATISIVNDDTTGGENPYTFAIHGYVATTPPEYTIYYENFDENNGSWVASTGSTTNWAHGTGLTTVSELGEGSYWHTNTYNDYSNNAYATVESPIISTTGYGNLVFSADIRYDLDADDEDGMIVEYRKRTAGVWSSWTILGSFGDTSGLNWYDGNGNVDAISVGSDGWTGDTKTTQTIQNFFQISKVNIPSTLDNSAEVMFRFVFASDNDNTDNGAAFDNVLIYADPITALSDPANGPGGANSNLKLWLKATSEVGTVTDGSDISTFNDNAFDNDAIGLTTNRPSFHDNATDNINFNPVIEFDRSNQEFMRGKGGYFSHDYFVVIQANGVVDNTGGNRMVPIGGRVANLSPQVDGTGLGFGSISARFTNEVIAHMASSIPAVPDLKSYGRALTSTTESYTDELMILNVKTDAAHTVTEIYKNGIKIDNTTGVDNASPYDTLNFSEFINQQYYLGVGRFSLNGNVAAYVDGKITEIISYKDTNSSTEQQKIHSYLSLKNGITYHASGSTTAYNENDIDYIDSDGTVIWDTSDTPIYNFDIAGIGRDDVSEFNQKQGSSSNDAVDGTGPIEGIVSMGLTNIYATNSTNVSTNTNTFGDKEFLVWGDNNVSLDAAPSTIAVDMSDSISGLSTPVSFLGMQRIWKVVETGGDIGSVEVSIPLNAVRNISPPGSYLMFISDTDIFDPTADYRVMTEVGGNLYANYDFDGTKYITFGYAPQIVVERSVQFDGSNDYVDIGDHKDLNTSFTISSWIKRTSGATNVSILSKRDATFTEGYDFKIRAASRLEMVWNGGSDYVRGNTAIPEDEWHHVAVIYSGGTANLYIDGVLDETETGLSNPTATTQSFIIAAAGKTSTTDFFEGNIDEVRIWDVALSEDELRYIMNQEIEENATFVEGMVIPTTITKNEVNSIPWSDLAGYYPMSIYTYTNTNDHSDNQNQGALRNLDTVDHQTAPLPYESDDNGAWTTDATWLNNSVQTLPNDVSIIDGTTPIDWNIVETNHNITIDTYTNLGRERSVLGLTIDSGEIKLNGDNATSTGNGLTVTHYLELNGSIDLDGESQLIQSDRSVLVVGINGELEKDQQGTADNFTYNYWASPVGSTNTTSTNATYASRFTLPDVLMDGTTAATPATINFLTSGYNGTNTNPIGLADYWIWKFANQSDDDYSAWQHVRSTGTIYPGEGYTMKGPGTGSIITDQNYVFGGEPNNGDIALTISAGNDYLIGNPYPSAIDALVFLSDNMITDGTLYFWEHWGGGSHNLGDYLGGYAQYNYAGGVGSATQGTNDPDVGTGGTPLKTPGQFIPVSQGFFVYSAGGGTITFKNQQRVFEKKGVNSTFLRTASAVESQASNSNEDTRMKFRIGFNSFNEIHRQLLLTVDENASPSVDWGYEGRLNEQQIDDMYWMVEGGKYVIQGTNQVNTETVVPLGIHVRDNGMNNITIDKLENVPDNVEIYAHDNVLNIYHDLRQSNYDVNLTTGSYLNRFAIVFTNPDALGIDDNELNNAFEVLYNNDSENIIIHNPTLVEVNSLELFNMLGQSVYNSKEIELENYTEIKASNLSSGTYIINLNTVSGKISKKVLVN